MEIPGAAGSRTGLARGPPDHHASIPDARNYDAPPAFTLSDQFFGYVGYDVNGLPVVVRGAEMNSMAKLVALNARSPTGKLHQLEMRTQMLLAEANIKAADSQQRLLADVSDIEAANAEAEAINGRITPILTSSLGIRPEKRRGRLENVVVRPAWLYLRTGTAGHAGRQRISPVRTAARL